VLEIYSKDTERLTFSSVTVGTFKVSGVFPLSEGQSYCVPNGLLENDMECSCSSSPENMAKMDSYSDGTR
jgi:phospholipase B1